MNKAVGWAIGGAVLSITAGVLVGLVVHIGQVERADRLPQPTPSLSARVTQTGTYTGLTNTRPEETTRTTPTPGSDVAGQPCPALAAKSGDATGTTLYCQVDQTDRTLRWRAVVDNGGCLNQNMTGIAADGRTYQCRLDDSGRNHWALAG